MRSLAAGLRLVEGHFGPAPPPGGSALPVVDADDGLDAQVLGKTGVHGRLVGGGAAMIGSAAANDVRGRGRPRGAVVQPTAAKGRSSQRGRTVMAGVSCWPRQAPGARQGDHGAVVGYRTPAAGSTRGTPPAAPPRPAGRAGGGWRRRRRRSPGCARRWRRGAQALDAQGCRRWLPQSRAPRRRGSARCGRCPARPAAPGS